MIGASNNQLWRGETVLIQRSARFYGDTFLNCHLKLEEGVNPVFMLCVLQGCTFDPPFVIDDPKSWPWLRCNSNVIDFAPAPAEIAPAPLPDLPMHPYTEASKTWGLLAAMAGGRPRTESEVFQAFVDCLRVYESERAKMEKGT